MDVAAETSVAPALPAVTLEMSRSELIDFVGAGRDRIAAQREEIEAFAQRVKALHASVAGASSGRGRGAERAP
jgi:hypothetical protein